MFPRPDPWVEQARRAAEHRARRRRRRLRWMVPAAAAVVVAGGVAAWVGLTGGTGDAGSEVLSSPATTSVTTTTVAPTTSVAPASTTLPPEALVEVDEVWLVDRGDGRFDWGVAIAVPDGAPNRSGVVVDVRLLADDGATVDEQVTTLDGISATPTAVVGVHDAGDAEPVRIEFDVTVGAASDQVGPAGLLEVRAVEYDESAGTVDGRVRSSAVAEVTGVEMVLVWRDDETVTDDRAPIVAVATYQVERIRPGVDALFSIDLAALDAPARVPDDVLWMPTIDP
ncbi:MAG: hypothetical protein AAF945_08590 [Actinomycetota bacterium]